MNFLLIGRANVGKSSIYNILTGSNANIIHKLSGTTRDWHKGQIFTLEQHNIFDTPGFTVDTDFNKKSKLIKILGNILSDIDIFLFVVDYKSFYNSADDNIIRQLRKYDKEIILIINKFDNPKNLPNNEYFKYAIKKVFFVSCSHNYGFTEFKKFINDNYSINNKVNHLNHKVNKHSIAIFGKPNSGKSTFLNTLLGYERSFTSSKAGTTSDYINENFNYKSKNITIIDTAGIGRKSKIEKNSVSFYSIRKTFEKIDQVSVAFILIDSSVGFNRQDKRIINLISLHVKSLIIIFNKKDLILDFNNFKKEMMLKIEYSLHQTKNVKVFFCSAFSQKQILKIIDYVILKIFNKKYKISTSELNKWLKNTTTQNEHPRINNKRINFKYAVQIKNFPITIKIFCNYSSKINKAYQRYLISNFNNTFNILNYSTKIIFSKSENPFR